jgi:hypothetical protein
MKPKQRSIRIPLSAIVCILSIITTLFLSIDAHGRAGRGESYRSRGSDSSSYGGSGRDSLDRFRSHLNPSYTGDGTGYYHNTREYVPGDYEDDFTSNSWSAVLTVNRDGSVEVAETFDVSTHREQKGIARNVSDYFNILLLSGLSSPQGHAGYRASVTSALQFAFGYNEKKAPGRHVFTLKYNAIGMVVPSGSGTLFQARLDPDNNAVIKSVTIVLSPGVAAHNVRAVESGTWDRFLRPEKELPCTVAGNSITVSVNRKFANRLILTADLPAGAVDPTALRKNLALVLEKQNLPALDEYRTRITINPDRTVDREETYQPAPGNSLDRATIWYDRYFHSAFFPEGSTSDDPQHVNNTLYLYGFQKKSCEGDDFTSGSVCVHLDRTGRKQTGIRYSAWGNYNAEEPFLYEFNLPPAETKWTGRVRFEIAFPAFVKKHRVKALLYLARFDGLMTSQRREIAFTGRWEGNRLTGEYDAALVDRQLVQARIFLPPDGFGEPGLVKKTGISLSYYWYFERIVFIGALAFAGLLLAGIPSLIFFFIRRAR